MKLSFIIVLLLLFTTLTATQCEKCIEGDMMLSKKGRSWLPLKGKTFLEFYDNSGSLNRFALQVRDTIETATNADCAATYHVESIQALLMLDAADSSHIWAQCAPPEDIAIHALNKSDFYIGAGGILNTKDRPALTHYNNITFPNRTYSDVVLTVSFEPEKAKIDSIYLAKGYGFVGFRFNGKNFYLK